ncbi:hypothetical protein CRYUN_Cryun14cG0009900 [Craigia yunnanensis]
MPPRIAKRGATSAGPKRTPRSTRGASKSQNPPPEPVEEAVKVEEASVQVVKVREEEEEEVVEDVQADEKPIVKEKVVIEEEVAVMEEIAGLNLNVSVAMKKENELKESIEEYEKDERLELDDNEPEEYGGMDYDEKEMDPDKVRDEVEEESEVEQDGEDKEGHLSDEEDVHEVEVESDDDDEHAGEEVEHAELADAAEHEQREVVQERRKRKEFEVFVGDKDPDKVRDEVEEESEVEQDGEDKEGHLSDEEDVHEVEVESDDDDEHAGEEVEHAELADAAEHEQREVVQERRKRKEFEVFVGGLDKDATEDDIRKAFSQVGEVVEVRLMMNPQTKKNKGFAFLRFATVEQAKRAFTEFKNPVINGKQCGVNSSQDSDTLFLGNICRTWTKEALKEKLKHYGVDNVEDLTLVEDSNNEGLNRGFAFLEFASRSDAMDAFKRLQRRDVLFGVDRSAKVSFADSFIDPGDEIMAQVRTTFIDCLPPWDEDRVRELLKEYGEIEKIELARNMPSADRKDYGFVTFDTHDAAVICAKSINNTELGEGDSKAKVRARLSRPHQRGRGRHIVRDSFRSGHGSGLVVRGSWGRPAPHGFPPRRIRGISSRAPPPSLKRPVGLRDRRPIMSAPARGRPLAPHPSRSYDRRALVPPYPKSSLKREYSRHDELPPPRSRAVMDYGSRVVTDRRPSYREEYSSRNSGYSDLPRSTSRTATKRPYVDDAYAQIAMILEKLNPNWLRNHQNCGYLGELEIVDLRKHTGPLLVVGVAMYTNYFLLTTVKNKILLLSRVGVESKFLVWRQLIISVKPEEKVVVAFTKLCSRHFPSDFERPNSFELSDWASNDIITSY